MAARARLRFFSLAALLLLGALLLGKLWWQEPPSRELAAPEREPAPDAAVVARQNDRRSPSFPRVPRKPASASCTPAFEEHCYEGDVWVLNSCGEPEEKLDECGRQACRVDECEEEPSEPCREPEEGRCDRDTIRMCYAGRLKTVDCAARGQRCVLGEEGAECAEPVPASERCGRAAAHCEGDVLVQCEQGRLQRIDCIASAAKCLSVPGLGEPRCVHVRLPELALPGCGPCGCPGKSKGEQRCDGQDDDGNGFLDDGLQCGSIDVIAFIVTDASGQSSHAREDVEQELATVNRLFLDEEGTPVLSFVLKDVQMIAAPELRDLEGREFGKLASDPRVHPALPNFYVPLLFTDSIDAEGSAPKLGISTLPNGTCGGLQEGFGPEIGLVALSKVRSPTTLTHELGHFFGLCHTHDAQRNARVVAAPAASGELIACRTSCLGEGDGVCDTPFDPGPNVCAFDDTCRTACATGADPDTRNLMSYYTPCRQRFSAEQRALMQHTVALRRAWYGCTQKACACSLGDDSCPVGMTCREYVASNGEHERRCGLDGPRAPGATCESSAQCGASALCMANKAGIKRCVRPCTVSRPDCQCIKAADDLSVCAEDIK